MSDMSGILLVDKPKSMTSHDVVDFIRKKFGVKKVGHAGTLDPSATGLLVILVGKATKLSSRLSGSDKVYEGVLTLGKKTDSGDADGKTVLEGSVEKVSEADIRGTFRSFEGDIEQVPPMISAIHHKGRRLYELARKGREVPREARKINISRLEISGIDLPDVRFSVTCSKGTYIRKLCDDIGDKLGCGGYLSRLRRIRSGDFNIDGAANLDRIKTFTPGEMMARLLKYE
jgi:tRNA pseudouridine55 synthase